MTGPLPASGRPDMKRALALLDRVRQYEKDFGDPDNEDMIASSAVEFITQTTDELESAGLIADALLASLSHEPLDRVIFCVGVIIETIAKDSSKTDEQGGFFEDEEIFEDYLNALIVIAREARKLRIKLSTNGGGA